MPVRDDISQMLRYSSSMNFELIILKKLCKTCANFGLIKLLWKKLVSLHVNKLHHLTRLSKASKETKSVVNCMENGDSRSLHFPRSVACSGESLETSKNAISVVNCSKILMVIGGILAPSSSITSFQTGSYRHSFRHFSAAQRMTYGSSLTCVHFYH